MQVISFSNVFIALRHYPRFLSFAAGLIQTQGCRLFIKASFYRYTEPLRQPKKQKKHVRILTFSLLTS
jgi:hypothetical protein